MGAVAAKLADFFVITAEDPRTEKVEDISEGDCRVGERKREHRKFTKQSSLTGSFVNFKFLSGFQIVRRRLILRFTMAKTGDVIGLFGKGHEKSMCFGKTEMPWSEHEAVKKALKICAESSDT